MADPHPAATHHIPAFITAPGQADTLMVVMSIILVLAVMMFGILFLRLHTLPERIAHKSHKLQFEIIAVLGLIALFTHMHIFWIAGLLLAMIDLPDFGTSLNRIAGSAERIAGIKPGEGADLSTETPPPSTAAEGKQVETAHPPSEPDAEARKAHGAGPSSEKLEVAPTKPKELVHA